MTKKSRTLRTPGFKKKVALEALKEDKTLSQLASQYSVHPLQVQVSKRKRELINGAECLFENKKTRSKNDDIDRAALEKKIGQLTMENDFLKKNWVTNC